jgi:hypothetical protein
MNRTELAEALGLSRQMLNRHQKAGRIKPEPDGTFDLEKIKAQLAANVKKQQSGSRRKPFSVMADPVVSSEAGTLAEAQLAHEKARAKKAQLLVGQLEEKLIDSRQAELAWSGHIAEARNRLLTIEGAARVRFGDEIGNWLHTEIRRALAELSEYQPAAA